MARPRGLLNENSNWTKEQKEEKKTQQELIESSVEIFKKTPHWFKRPLVKKIWKEATKILIELEFLKYVDYNTLAFYCNATANAIEIDEKIKGEHSELVYDSQGNEIKKPHHLIKAYIAYSNERTKLSSELGINLDSRLRLAELKIKELEGDDGYGSDI